MDWSSGKWVPGPNVFFVVCCNFLLWCVGDLQQLTNHDDSLMRQNMSDSSDLKSFLPLEALLHPALFVNFSFLRKEPDRRSKNPNTHTHKRCEWLWCELVNHDRNFLSNGKKNGFGWFADQPISLWPGSVTNNFNSGSCRRWEKKTVNMVVIIWAHRLIHCGLVTPYGVGGRRRHWSW